MSRNRAAGLAALAYVTFFRGTPLLCQLYLVYYGAGEVRPFLTDGRAVVVLPRRLLLLHLRLHAEYRRLSGRDRPRRPALRAAGPDRGGRARSACRRSASPATSCGPQALLVALRPLGNELISIVKASALAAS